MEQAQLPKRKLPAVEKSISDVDPEKDVRVRLLGTVIAADDSSIIVDDGTGKTEVVFENPDLIGSAGVGKRVRVVARVLPLLEGFECRGEAVQDLEGFNLELYRKAREA
ncbi:MAG: hypothetical protein HY362_01090 [Candidatus Aenigmarchaeota archaeon]|nr:hypothetical protein [Candidatus Aenigmarchaeota archaeon]